MKIYFNLFDEDLKEIWPQAMHQLRDVVFAELPKHMDSDLGYYAMQLCNMLMHGVYTKSMDLSNEIGLFEYDNTDLTDGSIEKTIGRFALELKVDEAIDWIDKCYSSTERRKEWLESFPKEEKIYNAMASFNWETFKPFYIGEITTTLRGIEEKIWQNITQTITKFIVQIEK